MEDVTISDAPPRLAAAHAGARWKDLREWLALVEDHRSLLRITGEVDPNEELSAITFMANPTSGRLNVGCYRQQLYSATRIGLNFVPGRHGEVDCLAQWAQGKPCEIVAAFGIDPVLFMVAGMRFGPDESELDAAGGIM